MRNRLTHTLEVSQIANTISCNLHLDTALTEAIALGHDLGHTPFGHAGERILNQIMNPGNDTLLNNPLNKNISGFKHNLQSIRVAVDLEWLYGKYGLDLTNFVLYGILNHSNKKWPDSSVSVSFYDKYEKEIVFSNQKPSWSFEAFVVSIADEIAQRHHDVEDAIEGKLMLPQEACDVVYGLFSKFFIKEDNANFEQMNMNTRDPSFVSYFSRFTVNLLTNRLIRTSISNLNTFMNNKGINETNFSSFMLNTDDAEVKKIIDYCDGDDNEFVDAEERFGIAIREKVLSSYNVQRMDAKGQYVIKRIFNAFYSVPEQLSDHTIVRFLQSNYPGIWQNCNQKGIGAARSQFTKMCNERDNDFNQKLLRTVCDHVSGMTDRFAIKEYSSLYGTDI